MEIYLIKEIERPRKIIQDYFFNYTDKLAYNEKMAYFISNSLAEKEYNQYKQRRKRVCGQTPQSR